MNWFILFLIMASLPIKLNAFDLTPPSSNAVKDLEVLMAKVNTAKKEGIPDYRYKFEREEILKSDDSCRHCPKHLLLTEQINKALEKMSKDPKTHLGNEIPVKINKLKFMYYEQAIENKNGQRDCLRFMDLTPDLRPTKFDGQFKLLAEDVLRFNSVTDIQYMNPQLDELVYYYRGEGSEKNLVVQAILTKEGGRFRYFRYTPTEGENNPYNLPDLDQRYVNTDEPDSKAQALDKGNLDNILMDSGKSTKTGVQTDLIGSESLGIKFKAEVEKRNKFIPKDVHFVEAKMNQEGPGGIKIKATSDFSLKGNKANVALTSAGGSELMLIDLDTKLTGQTNHRVTVPYSIRVLEESKLSVKGKLQHETDAQIVSMSITDQSGEYIRSEYRKNNSTGADSYVLAKDVQMGPKEILSVQYIKGEDNKKYASVKHVKSIRDNITLVLDVRVDQDRKASLYYQMSAKF